MSSHFDPLHHPHLTAHIRRVLKRGRITATSLPLTPEIRLYLLDADYPRHALMREETEALMDDPPFWSFCWSSGQVLARWIMEHKEVVADRRVLDFGTGSGIVAIAAARSGARRVVACDIDPVSLQAVRANGALNQVEIEVCTEFEEACPDLQEPEEHRLVSIYGANRR